MTTEKSNNAEQQDRDELKSRTISSLAWKLFERGGSAVVQLIVQIVMARLLAPEEFGSLAIMLVFVNVGGVIVQSGLNTALVQTPHADDDDFTTVFWLSLGISLVLYAAVFFSAPFVAEFFGLQGLVEPLRVLSLIMVINSFNAVQVAFVSRELRFKKIFIATLTSVVVSGALGIASAVAGLGLWALVVQQLAYQVVNCFALAFQVPWKPRFVFRPARAKELFSFGWKLLVSGLLEVGFQSLSDLIIGKQFSADELGQVSQGKRYPQAIGSMLDGAIQPVMMSSVSRVQDDKAYVKRLVRRALKTSTFFIVPCMACVALVAEPLIVLLLGDKWLPAVPFFQMYCFVYALLPIHTSNLQALNGVGRSDLFLKLEVIKKSYGLVFLLVAAFVMRDVYWIVGAYVVADVVATFVNAYPNKRVIGYAYVEQLRDIAPAFGLAAVSCLAAAPISLLELAPVATMLIQAFVMLGLYVLLARLFRVEAFSYLWDTGKQLLHKRGSRGQA